MDQLVDATGCQAPKGRAAPHLCMGSQKGTLCNTGAGRGGGGGGDPPLISTGQGLAHPRRDRLCSCSTGAGRGEGQEQEANMYRSDQACPPQKGDDSARAQDRSRRGEDPLSTGQR